MNQNIYAYVGGNPLSYADPLGLCPQKNRQRCESLRKKIDNLSALLRDKLAKYNPEQDFWGGWISRYSKGGVTGSGTHYLAIIQLQDSLRNAINLYEQLMCDQDDDDGPGLGSVSLAQAMTELIVEKPNPGSLPFWGSPSPGPRPRPVLPPLGPPLVPIP